MSILQLDARFCREEEKTPYVTRGEAEALSSDRPRRATSALIARDTRQPSRHTGHQPHQLNSRNPSGERETERETDRQRGAKETRGMEDGGWRMEDRED
ncbi:hypothetical protein EYF80_017452 [Liparis tanakae]|uniref:Uncharacterized protein n=1 Tax=Liparis tanakae TaxID=230148 RepID=A0A4Z2I3A3_9TELE|nr:hypothetical protein EYF80_017452 [Liparis tanakae]